MRKLKEVRLTNMTNSSSSSMLVIPSDKDSSFDDFFLGEMLIFIRKDEYSSKFHKKLSNYQLFKEELENATFDYINRLEQRPSIYFVNEQEQTRNLFLFVVAVEAFVDFVRFYAEVTESEPLDVENEVMRILKKIGKTLLPQNDFVDLYIDSMEKTDNLFIAKFSTLNKPVYVVENYLKILFQPVIDRKTYKIDEDAILQNYIELKRRIKSLMLVYEEEEFSVSRILTLEKEARKKSEYLLPEIIEIADEIRVTSAKEMETNVVHKTTNKSGRIGGIQFSLSSRKDNNLILYSPQDCIYAIYELTEKEEIEDEN